MRATIARHINAPFAWGSSDCGFVFDWVRDACDFDPIDDVRGYTSEREALRAVRDAGFETVADLVAARFVEIDPAMAQRGDLGYPADIPHPLMSPAIIDGAHAYSKHPAGGVIVPRSAIVRAWAV